jgi:hypothetical protein
MKERKAEAFLNVYRHNDHLHYCQKLHQRAPSQPAIKRNSHVTLKKKKIKSISYPRHPSFRDRITHTCQDINFMNDIFGKILISTLEKPKLHKVSKFVKFLELPNVHEIPKANETSTPKV